MPERGPDARGRGGSGLVRTTAQDEPAWGRHDRVGPLRSSGNGCLTSAVRLGPVRPV